MMSVPEDDSLADEAFLNGLAARDEALAAGATPVAPAEDTPPELLPRLERGEACIRLLRQVWPHKAVHSTEEPPPAPARSPLTQLGRFTLHRVLGRGACGVA